MKLLFDLIKGKVSRINEQEKVSANFKSQVEESNFPAIRAEDFVAIVSSALSKDPNVLGGMNDWWRITTPRITPRPYDSFTPENSTDKLHLSYVGNLPSPTSTYILFQYDQDHGGFSYFCRSKLFDNGLGIIDDPKFFLSEERDKRSFDSDRFERSAYTSFNEYLDQEEKEFGVFEESGGGWFSPLAIEYRLSTTLLDAEIQGYERLTPWFVRVVTGPTAGEFLIQFRCEAKWRAPDRSIQPVLWQ
ncbi:hypothetical protein BSR28_05905 [Boudabousia liubingyangii]|uniref:hypothetical protein n=1 Tax=Boudabousia liubingyangii TaxID=1921764 RepID=UPI00093FAD92|nr:hypothetical protein [Boudabousia liubingyangii]OKL46954.1 hypothetical protein BSR28_05905 [Boudabousia liubingyangii]